MATRAVGGPQNVLAADRLDIFDGHIRVRRAGLAVILHVDGVDGLLGIHVLHTDVVGSVAHFDRAPVIRLFEPYVFDSHVTYLQPVIAAGNRHRIATHAEGFDVANHAADDVASGIAFSRRD